MNKIIALLAGTLFGLGLGVSGMLDPAKIMNFLDVAGHWDPTLILVMGGAVIVSFPAFWLAKRSSKPLLAPMFQLPTRKDIDARLLIGAAIFGIGWGLGGLCPGPAVADLASAKWPVLAFVVAVIVGQVASDYVNVLLARNARAADVRRPAHADVGDDV